MKTRGALIWEPGTRSGWSVEEIEIDPPKEHEALVKLAASGICHSDDHVDTGDIPLPWAPILGGHEGAGIVEEVGPGVTWVQPGDPVVMSFLPSCGRCAMCVKGKGSLCELAAGVLSGAAPDGTHRVHARGQGVGCMSYLGTFSPYVCAPLDALVKVPAEMPLDKAALIGCGVPTGWGSSVYAADIGLGDTVVVFGTGGVGMNAVQGAKMKGARTIIALDSAPFKREKALEFGATHAAADFAEARGILDELTNGQGADVVIETVGVMHGDLLDAAQELVTRGGTLVLTGVAPAMQRDVHLDLFTVTLSGKRIQGSLYGTCNARTDIPLLADLYLRGELKLDELITRTYSLDDINQAFRDMHDGKNVRGVIIYD